MRTRRSPRNQAILWRALGGTVEPAPLPPPALTVGEIKAMWWLSKTSRNQLLRDAAKGNRRHRGGKKVQQ